MLIPRPSAPTPTEHSPAVHHTAGAVFLHSADAYLHKMLSNIDLTKLEGAAVHASSNGRWGFHELIVHAARELGGAHLLCSSYNISQAAANQFARAQREGWLLGIRLIINTSRRQDNAAAIASLNGLASVHFAPVHAKIAVLRGQAADLSIVSTGNLSSGGNVERVVIFSDPNTIQFDHELLEALLFQR